MKATEKMKLYGIVPSKSLGQNFLTDQSIIKKIVDCADIRLNDIIVEIGPGLGAITGHMANLLGEEGKLFAIELDKKLSDLLREEYKTNEIITVVNADILKTDLSGLLSENGINSNKKIKVVSNLPYYISTPVLFKLFEYHDRIKEIIIMVQKEVADRICALSDTPEYGALSVASAFYSKPEVLFDVSPGCFIPPPGVNSSVVKLTMCSNNLLSVKNKKNFFNLIKAAFGQRRKTLVNAMFNSGFFNRSKPELVEILHELGVDERVRGEVLSLQQFISLENLLSRTNTH